MDGIAIVILLAVAGAYWYFAHYRPTQRAMDPEIPAEQPSEEPVPLPDDVPLTQPVDVRGREPNVQIP